MTWLAFIAAIVQSIVSLAWPAALVLSVWIFRNDIRPLLPLMRLKHRDTELSFRLEEAEKVVETLPPPSPDLPRVTPEELSNFEKMAQVSPRSAMLEVRREIEDALKQRMNSKFPNVNWRTSPRQILRSLRNREAINSVAASLLDDVLAMGNIAAHDSNAAFTTEDARRYRAIADHALAMMDLPPPRVPEVYAGLPPLE